MSYFEDFLNKKVADPQPKTKNLPEKKKDLENMVSAPGAVTNELIDQKINDKINERLLKLVGIGLKHELTLENLERYFKETGKLKLYNLTRYFSDATPRDIDIMLHYFHEIGKITKDKNGWYQLK